MAEVEEKLKSANEKDYYRKAIQIDGFDNNIRNNRANFRAAEGIDLSDDYGVVKTEFGNLDSTYNDLSREIGQERQRINDEKNSAEAERSKSNAQRFGGSGK